MIMQEFKETSRRNQKKNSVFDNVQIYVSNKKHSTHYQSTSTCPIIQSPSTSTFNSYDEIPIKSANCNKNVQTPFPYLKRKSIRVDLVLKQQKEQEKKCKKIKVVSNSSSSQLATLKKEKKSLQEENTILKGRLLQMEKMFKEMLILNTINTINTINCKVVITKRDQECQTESNLKSSSCQTIETSEFSKCTKCNKSIRLTFMKHHERFCKSNKNETSNTNTSVFKNEWRMKRQHFLNQMKKDKMKQINYIHVAIPKRKF